MAKRVEITERINGTCKYIYCVYCRNIMFPKQILFRTTKTDGGVIFNYMGKDGFSCFIQYGTYTFCKKCAKMCKDDLLYVMNHLKGINTTIKTLKDINESINERIDAYSDFDDQTVFDV